MTSNLGGYTQAVVAASLEAVGQKAVAAYVTGSLAFGDFVPAESDIDIIAIAELPLPDRQRDRVVRTIAHPDFG